MPNWKKVVVSGSSAHLNQITGSGGIHLPDNAKITLGDAEDLQLYHDGSNSYIKDNGTGNLNYLGGTQTFQNAASSKTMMVLNSANSVDLNYNNSTKFQTTNTGVDVTGIIQASGNISGSSTSTGSFAQLRLNVSNLSNSGSEVATVDGTQGRLFTVSDEMSGSIFSANTIAGLPVIEAFSDNKVNLGPFSSPIQIDGSGNISGSSTSILTMSEISSSGDIVAEGDVVAYYTSDLRLKDNVEVIQGSLDKIDDIRGVEFDWNEQSPGWARERGHDIGVIAQEVQKVIPEIVVERKNGYLGVDYKRLVPLLIESVKELRREVNDLKKKVV